MKKTSTIRNTIVGPLLLILAGTFGASTWAADAPPPAMFVETWGCTYNAGKDMEDVLKARDYMVSQAEKAGLALPDSHLWSLVKGNVPIETVWFNVHENFLAYTASSDAWVASGIGEAVLDRFDAVSSCSTGLATLTPTFGREGLPDDGTPTFVTSAGCRFKKGSGPGHLADLASHSRQLMAALGDNAPYFAAVIDPITAAPAGSPDLYMFTVHRNATEWGNYVNQLFTTDAGQMLRNHRDMVLDCDLTIWSDQLVVQATGSE